MKEQLLDFGRRGWESFRAFSPGQKAITLLATLALIIGGLLFASWKSKPDYAPLYSNLAATDASAIVDKLNAQKVPYQLAAGGTEILVPKDKVYATRLTMSSAGLPGSGQSGYSLLDKEGVTTSEFKQQVDYQRAIEGELAKTIQSINGVQAASVHLAIPKQDVFNDGTQKTTAAVMLTTAGGAQLSAAQVQSIVYLVSSSVPNMQTGDVTVTDASGRVLAAPGEDLGGAAGNDSRAQMTQDYNERLASSLQNMINAAIGAGHSVVTVNADLDFDKTSTTRSSYTYDPNTPPLSEQENSETYTGNGAGTGGPLGAGTPAASASAEATGGSYSKTSKTVNNALGTVTETTQNAPGAVRKLSIAVLLDDSVKNLDVAGIEELVKSAVGMDAARGDSIAIKAMPFDQSTKQAADAAAQVAAKAAADKAAHERMMSLIKQGILAGILLVILVGTWLASRRRRRTQDLPPPPVEEGFFGDGDDQFRPLQDDPAEELAVVSDLDEARSRRKALVALAEEQPDDVARVLSGWLNSREG